MSEPTKTITAEERVRELMRQHRDLAEAIITSPTRDRVAEAMEAHAAAEKAPLEAEVAELQRQLDRAIRDGHLRRCDIPACNCGGYHSGYAARMMENAEERNEARSERDAEKARADRAEAEVNKLREAATLALEAIEAGQLAPAIVALRWAVKP